MDEGCLGHGGGTLIYKGCGYFSQSVGASEVFFR